MRNLPFVIWMLGWPLLSIFEDYVNHIRGFNKTSSSGEFPLIAFIELFVWILVGFLLYEKKEKKKE